VHMNSIRRVETMIRETLGGISSPDDVHQRYAWDLSYPPSQFACSNNVTLLRSYTLDEGGAAV